MQEHSTEAPHGKTLAVLHDPAGLRKRTAQSLSWHPDGSRKIAVAYCVMEFQACTFALSLSTTGNSRGLSPKSQIINPKLEVLTVWAAQILAFRVSLMIKFGGN